jgi:hypothetical protein
VKRVLFLRDAPTTGEEGAKFVGSFNDMMSAH